MPDWLLWVLAGGGFMLGLRWAASAREKYRQHQAKLLAQRIRDDANQYQALVQAMVGRRLTASRPPLVVREAAPEPDPEETPADQDHKRLATGRIERRLDLE